MIDLKDYARSLRDDSNLKQVFLMDEVAIGDGSRSST